MREVSNPQAEWMRRGRRCCRHHSRSFPADLEDPMPEQLHPAATVVEQISSLWRTLCQGRWICPGGSCNLWRTPQRSRLLAEEELTQAQVFWQELRPVEESCWSNLFLLDCSQWGEPMLEQSLKNCSWWEGPTLDQFVKDCILHGEGRDPMSEHGNNMRRKENRTKLLWTRPQLPFPIPLRYWGRGGGGRRVRN